MPVHTAPFFRNMELAKEAAGLIAPQNSDGYNVVKNQEAAGVKGIYTVPLVTFIFNGVATKAKE